MEIGDFLSQIPLGLIVWTCGSGVLFLLAVSLIMQRRSKRRAADLTPSSLTTEEPPAPTDDEASEEPTGPNLLARVSQGVHDFFFYSEEEKAAMATQPADPPTAAPAASGLPTSSAAAPPEAVEVMHVWRDIADGSLIIQIGTQTYRTMAEITAAGQERRFMSALRELARLAKNGAGEAHPAPPTPPVPVETPAPRVEPAQPENVSAPPPAEPVEPEPEPFTPNPDAEAIVKQAQQEPERRTLSETQAAQKAAPAEEEDEEALGSFFDNVLGAVRRGGRVPPKQPEPQLNIADEIEDLLQQRLLAASAAMRSREIHVRPSLDGGVRIEVDGQFYEGVGDINDEDVRAFVMETIQIWESRR